MLDTLMLSRLQFAANISFHILFPMITIALAWVLLFFKLRYNATGDDKWMNAYRLWVKVFALSFAMGVVSGITMSFQFGTNWPGFMETVGNIAGPLLAYEVLTAFFLEATFLGIMLFGRKRVSNRVHTLATWMVAVGTSLSAFWILVLNSWMQTPTGFEMREGQAHVVSWLEVIFNPSMPYRLVHMMLAAGLTAAFVVAGLSAFRQLRGDQTEGNRTALRVGVWLAAILIPVQIVAGDLHGLNTLEHQPAKVAAMEGLWETQRGAPLVLFGMPHQHEETTRYAIEIPSLSSLILTHDLDGEVKGLKEWPADERPPAALVFWSFRLMVGLGMLMIATGVIAIVLYFRKRLFNTRWFQYWCMALTPAGFVAVLAGWFVTEVGRQPWIVQGVMRTSDATSPVAGTSLAISLTAFLTLALRRRQLPPPRRSSLGLTSASPEAYFWIRSARSTGTSNESPP